MVETIVNVPFESGTVSFKIKSNKQLDQQTVQNIIELPLTIYWSDKQGKHFSMDTKLNSGLWLENIFYNNELSKAVAIILN